MSAARVTFRGASWFPVRHFAATVAGTYACCASWLLVEGTAENNLDWAIWKLPLVFLAPFMLSFPFSIALAAPSFGLWRLTQWLNLDKAWHHMLAGALLPLTIVAAILLPAMAISKFLPETDPMEDYSPFANATNESLLPFLGILMIGGASAGAVFHLMGGKEQHA